MRRFHVIKWVMALLAATVLMASCNEAFAEEDWTDEQIVNAIYQAEGGAKAQYPYGIRSVKCAGKDSCYLVCKRTVRNNRKRFKEYGHKDHRIFIEFLASKYCPIGAGNDPKNLNKNWLKNVKFYLAKDRK